MPNISINYEAVVIGASAGGMHAIQTVLEKLPETFTPPICIVQHLHKSQDSSLAALYNKHSALPVQEAHDKCKLSPSTVYLAPADYHLQVEPNRSLSLSLDQKVNFSRPSIDVLFESAAHVYGPQLIGIILTGANHDGALGLKTIKSYSGTTVVQNPETAAFQEMPRSAIAAAPIDHILELEQIGSFLTDVCIRKVQ